MISRILDGWEDLAQLMKPATVKRWHSQAFRLYWLWPTRRGLRRTTGEAPNERLTVQPTPGR